MRTILQDFRFALRRLRHDGAFSLSVLAMLALGLAASVAMFTVLRGVVMSALPYPDAGRVVSLEAVNPEQGVAGGSLTLAESIRFTTSPTPFEAFGYYMWNGITIVEGGEPREITVNWVSEGFFPALGIRPLLGRWIEARDIADDAPVIVLSYTEWQRMFGGDPGAIGTMVDSDRGRVEVIGVMPPEFAFPTSDPGAWQPYPARGVDPSRPGYWKARFVDAVARVAPGVSAEQLDERMAQMVAEVRATHGVADNGWRIAASPVLEGMIASVRPVLWGAFAIALLVLLIACVNSAILLDARLVRRARELAIAQALGAGSGRLRRILAFELLIVVATASGIAMLLIAFTLERFRAFAADRLPRADAIALDGEAVGFALAAAASALALIVLQARRLNAQPAAALRSAGTGFGTKSTRRRWRLLPAVGIALSTVGVASAVALALSLAAMQSVDPGLRTKDVFVVQLFRSGEPEGWGPFADQVLERLRALPGVEKAEVASSMPMSGIGTMSVDLEKPGSQLREPLQASVRRASPGFTALLDIGIVEGRGFDDGDRAGSEPVMIVSRTLARRVFGEASALDQRIAVPSGRGPPVEHRIVGVMEDVRNDTLRTAPQPELLVPFAQAPWLAMSFVVRGATLDASIVKAMQSTIWSIDPREGITRAFPLDEDLEAQLQPSRFFVATIGLFALASLLLGALGVYAVTAFVQRQRTPEYGLKLAIGAPPRAMAREILGETLVVAAVGLAFGLAGAAASLRLLSGQLFEIGASDVAAYATAVVTIAATALLAALAPAVRAARIDPMQALRNE